MNEYNMRVYKRKPQSVFAVQFSVLDVSTHTFLSYGYFEIGHPLRNKWWFSADEQQFDQDGNLVATQTTYTTIEPGDWLVREIGGFLSVVPHDIFMQQYELE